MSGKITYPPMIAELPEEPRLPLAVLPISDHTRRLILFINASSDRDLALSVMEGMLDLGAALAARVTWVDAVRKIDPTLADEMHATALEMLALVARRKGGES